MEIHKFPELHKGSQEAGPVSRQSLRMPESGTQFSQTLYALALPHPHLLVALQPKGQLDPHQAVIHVVCSEDHTTRIGLVLDEGFSGVY